MPPPHKNFFEAFLNFLGSRRIICAVVFLYAFLRGTTLQPADPRSYTSSNNFICSFSSLVNMVNICMVLLRILLHFIFSVLRFVCTG